MDKIEELLEQLAFGKLKGQEYMVAHHVLSLLKGARYYVASGEDKPEQLFFDPQAAFASDYVYLDVFNAQGELEGSWKKVDDEWTGDF
jgi:hypothetical protein